MRHPDEGIIHSWLDDALTAEETRQLEAHVATCAECAAAVAGARGVRAAATRILSALDDVPAGVIPSPDYFADFRAASDAAAASRRRGGAVWRRHGVRAAAGLIAVGALSWAVVRNVPSSRDEANVAVIEQATPVADVAPAARETTTADTAPAPAALPAPPRTTDGARKAPAAVAGTVAARTEAKAGEESLRRLEPSRDAALRAERETTPSSPIAAAAPAAMAVAPAPRRVDSMLADRAANTAVAGSDAVSGKAAPPVAQGIAEPRTPRIVIERAYVDSVLAADSLDTALGSQADARTMTGASSRAAAPMLERSREASRAGGASTTLAAQGCWVLETSDWTPRLRARDTVRVLPRRVELRSDRGIVAEEAGQRLVRPAPGDPPLAPGVTAYWRVIATDQVRFTITDPERWTTVTATVAADSLHGTARAYTNSDRLMRRATIKARRVVCRTEP